MVRIRVSYRSFDRFNQSRTFRTLAGAQRFAQKWVGECPEHGNHYAISGDGVGRVTVAGCALLDLFPQLKRCAGIEQGFDDGGRS